MLHQEALGAANLTFVSCSAEVERILGPDIMRSVAHLVPDILEHLPILLYQGSSPAYCSLCKAFLLVSTNLAWCTASTPLHLVGFPGMDLSLIVLCSVSLLSHRDVGEVILLLSSLSCIPVATVCRLWDGTRTLLYSRSGKGVLCEGECL